MDEIIILTIQLLIAIVAFLIGKTIKSITLSNEKLYIIEDWANKFVVYARKFLETKEGAEKMSYVIKELQKIAKKKGISMTEEQLKAIAQTAYEEMEAGYASGTIKEK